MYLQSNLQFVGPCGGFLSHGTPSYHPWIFLKKNIGWWSTSICGTPKAPLPTSEAVHDAALDAAGSEGIRLAWAPARKNSGFEPWGLSMGVPQ